MGESPPVLSHGGCVPTSVVNKRRRNILEIFSPKVAPQEINHYIQSMECLLIRYLNICIYEIATPRVLPVESASH